MMWRQVLEGLNELRADALFCDVILRVGEQTFPAHKNVLAAFSPYFKVNLVTDMQVLANREFYFT